MECTFYNWWHGKTFANQKCQNPRRPALMRLRGAYLCTPALLRILNTKIFFHLSAQYTTESKNNQSGEYTIWSINIPSISLETNPMLGQLPFSTIFSNSVLLHNRCVGHWWHVSCWFISRLVRHALCGEINMFSDFWNMRFVRHIRLIVTHN